MQTKMAQRGNIHREKSHAHLLSVLLFEAIIRMEKRILRSVRKRKRGKLLRDRTYMKATDGKNRKIRKMRKKKNPGEK